MSPLLSRLLPSRLGSFIGLVAALVTATRAQDAGGDPLNPPAPEPSITWLEPAAGTNFPTGKIIGLQVEAVDPAGAITDVEFVADGRVIGRSQLRFLVPPAPGAPLSHTLQWTGAPAGGHMLVAWSIRADGRVVKSAPREIRVETAPGDLPVVTVQTLDGEMREGREEDVVTFEVRRTGPTAEALTVWFGLEGTATPRVDYDRVPADPVPLPEAAGDLPEPGLPPQYTVDIPAGAATAVVTYRVLADPVREVNEVLMVALQQPIPPPNVRMQKTYEVGAPGSARAWIVDAAEAIEPSLVLVRPVAGTSYTAPADLRMEAVARDPAGVIRRVAFFDGEKQVGGSELDFTQPLPPGTPLTHVFTWRGVPAGEHVLSARAATPAGQELRSAPVAIRVAAGVETAVVTLEATRGMTAEPGPAGPALPGVFTLRRTGPVSAPLRVLYWVSGTARNGVDYTRLDGDATLAAGSATREILVEPQTDAAVEGAETVILNLRPDPAYRVGAAAGATVAITDASPTPAARLTLSSPGPGQRFIAPADIPLKAAAVDPAGWIGRVDFLVNGAPVAMSELVFIRAPDPGAVLLHEAVWAGAKPGRYRLNARARTAAGQEVVSAAVEIVVAEPPPAPWAVRELPDRHVPGTELEVRLALAPPPGAAAVAVEDQPPKGWAVGAISDGGAFDAVTGRVKFGPFLDNPARTMTYRVTPPAGATGRAEFSGRVSVDGRDALVGGDRILEPQLFHPADQAPADGSLGMGEMTAYAAAWREGREWTPGPNPIPLSHVTRAAFLWKSGEAYRHDPTAGPLPMAWVPAPRATPAGETGEPPEGLPTDGTAEPAVNWMRPSPGLALAEMAVPDPATGRSRVTVRALPGPGIRAYGIELWIPEGLAADAVSEAGFLDPSGRVVRWGPFLDAEPRRFEFQVTGPVRSRLAGRFSADGYELPVAVVLESGPPPDPAQPRIAHVETGDAGQVQLVVEDPAAGDCEVEMSTDLRTWRVVGRTPAGQEASLHADTDATEQPVRFYRVRRRN